MTFGSLNDDELKPINTAKKVTITPPVLTLTSTNGRRTLDTDAWDFKMSWVLLLNNLPAQQYQVNIGHNLPPMPNVSTIQFNQNATESFGEYSYYAPLKNSHDLPSTRTTRVWRDLSAWRIALGHSHTGIYSFSSLDSMSSIVQA